MGEIFISSSSTPRFPTTLAVSRLAFVANAYWAARMQTAQRIINHYRRNRFIVCTICALVTLILTLSIRFISERNLNHHRTVAFANHAVDALDNVLHPLLVGRNILLPLLELPCATAHLPLRKQAARLQTIRSIGLVKEGILYCSSIFGARNTPIRQLQPDLPGSRRSAATFHGSLVTQGKPDPHSVVSRLCRWSGWRDGNCEYWLADDHAT